MLVVDGGATMNPSTYELLAGIHAAPGAEVLVLPNSPNVILAAERAAELSEKPARVVPTTAPQEGLAALLAFDPNQGSDANEAVVHEAAEALRAGRRRAGRARRRPGPLHGRRRGRLRRRRAGRLGRPGRDARRHARPDRRGRRAAHLHRRRAAAARPRRGGGARPRGRGGGVPRGRPARVVVAALRGVNSVRLERSRCPTTPPVRSYPRPSLLAEPIDGPKALERLGIATWGDLIEHLPHAHRDRRDVRLVGELARGGGGDRGRGRPRRDRQADARPAPQARRGARVRRERPAGGGLVQPALDRPPARARARRCCCTASCAGGASSG